MSNGNLDVGRGLFLADLRLSLTDPLRSLGRSALVTCSKAASPTFKVGDRKSRINCKYKDGEGNQQTKNHSVPIRNPFA
ncbi:hypothetical protein COAQ111491_05695 [Comamonas aquatilis]